VPFAGEQPHAGGLAPRHQAESVVRPLPGIALELITTSPPRARPANAVTLRQCLPTFCCDPQPRDLARAPAGDHPLGRRAREPGALLRPILTFVHPLLEFAVPKPSPVPRCGPVKVA
jgi:hypothetical protein